MARVLCFETTSGDRYNGGYGFMFTNIISYEIICKVIATDRPGG